jgi:hypothetical protein
MDIKKGGRGGRGRRGEGMVGDLKGAVIARVQGGANLTLYCMLYRHRHSRTVLAYLTSAKSLFNSNLFPPSFLNF